MFFSVSQIAAFITRVQVCARHMFHFYLCSVGPSYGFPFAINLLDLSTTTAYGAHLTPLAPGDRLHAKTQIAWMYLLCIHCIYSAESCSYTEDDNNLCEYAIPARMVQMVRPYDMHAWSWSEATKKSIIIRFMLFHCWCPHLMRAHTGSNRKGDITWIN